MPKAQTYSENWSRLREQDCEDLVTFLRAQEYRCVEGSELVKDLFAQASFKNAELPEGFACWIHRIDNGFGASGGIDGMTLCRRNGNCYCILPSTRADDDELGKHLRAFSAYLNVLGQKIDVVRMQDAARLEIAEIQDYVLMISRPMTARPMMAKSGLATATTATSPYDATLPSLLPSLIIRDALWHDLQALCTLHSEYLIEELRLPAPVAQEDAAKKVPVLLESQHVVMALVEGAPVGKANTNARGFAASQIGGVYVRPQFRGHGVASSMVAALVRTLAEQGQSCVLFVRPDNTAAIRVYAKLGFEAVGEYRAAYGGIPR